MILLLWLYSKNCDENPRITSLKSKLINGKKMGILIIHIKYFLVQFYINVKIPGNHNHLP